MNIKKPENRKVSYGYIKGLALISMTIDHVGAILYPNDTVFRYIGRLAFPIFLFMLINSYKYTKDRKAFFIRLIIFAIISEIPYYIAFGHNFNIGFTFLNLLIFVNCIEKIKRTNNWAFRVFIISIAFMTVIVSIYEGILHTYGAYALGMGVLINYRDEIEHILFMFYSFIIGFFAILLFRESYMTVVVTYIIVGCMVLFENNLIYKSQTAITKYIYYIYYPAHLAILCSIKLSCF